MNWQRISKLDFERKLIDLRGKTDVGIRISIIYRSDNCSRDRDDFFNLGRNPADPNAGFNMTAFALRMSAYHNGVSVKHGEVFRKMWQPLWPDKPEEQDGRGSIKSCFGIRQEEKY